MGNGESRSPFPMKNNMKTETKTTGLYLIEFYANGPQGQEGWEINFAWVYASDRQAAKDKLKKRQGKRFYEVILCDEQAEIIPLVGNFRVNTRNANLFIYQ